MTRRDFSQHAGIATVNYQCQAVRGTNGRTARLPVRCLSGVSPRLARRSEYAISDLPAPDSLSHTALSARQDSIETPYRQQASNPITPAATMGCGMSKQDGKFELDLRESGDRCRAVSLAKSRGDQRKGQRKELTDPRQVSRRKANMDRHKVRGSKVNDGGEGPRRQGNDRRQMPETPRSNFPRDMTRTWAGVDPSDLAQTRPRPEALHWKGVERPVVRRRH